VEPKLYDTGSSKTIIKPGKDAIVSNLLTLRYTYGVLGRGSRLRRGEIWCSKEESPGYVRYRYGVLGRGFLENMVF
jgi:hypothetical protein